MPNLYAAITPTQIILIVLLAVMVIVLIVLPMFTNKKRTKAVNELHSSIATGDVIKTVGGIIGTVLSVREISPVDKEMVIETGVGNNKTTLVFDIQAVYQVISKANAPVAPIATEEVKEEAKPEIKEEVVEAAKPEIKEESVVATVDKEEVKVEPAVKKVGTKKPAAKSSTTAKK